MTIQQTNKKRYAAVCAALASLERYATSIEGVSIEVVLPENCSSAMKKRYFEFIDANASMGFVDLVAKASEIEEDSLLTIDQLEAAYYDLDVFHADDELKHDYCVAALALIYDRTQSMLVELSSICKGTVIHNYLQEVAHVFRLVLKAKPRNFCFFQFFVAWYYNKFNSNANLTFSLGVPHVIDALLEVDFTDASPSAFEVVLRASALTPFMRVLGKQYARSKPSLTMNTGSGYLAFDLSLSSSAIALHIFSHSGSAAPKL